MAQDIFGGWVMSFRGVKAVLLACSGIGVLLAATADANAGGLAVREQSAYGQGSSYAGVAAGGSLSSMFWNPATMTQVPGLQSESVMSGLIPSSSNTPTGGTYAGAPFSLGGTGNVAHSALVPASYFSWQLNQKLWIGLSVNSPFGLSETFPDTWAGRVFAAGGESLKTYNFAPTVAYKFNDLLSIGFGAQIQYASAAFTQGIPGVFPGAGLTQQAGVSGAGYGYGFTAGATLTPTPTTSIGLGYRSGINQKINGTLVLPAAVGGPPVSTPGSVNTTFNIPDIVSLGLRQKLTSQWTAMATVEWTNWSRAGTSAVLQPNGQPALLLNGFGGGAVVIPFQYKNGWFFSAGAEYQWSPQIALRGGVAYEISPVTDQVRGPAIPDNDRTWLSIGGTYKYSAKTTIDLAYSHVFVKTAPINITDPSNPFYAIGGGTTYTGSVNSHLDIISLALKYRWDDPAPAPTSTLYHK
jgi:long-chain fatty acid transport protein